MASTAYSLSPPGPNHESTQLRVPNELSNCKKIFVRVACIHWHSGQYQKEQNGLRGLHAKFLVIVKEMSIALGMWNLLESESVS